MFSLKVIGLVVLWTSSVLYISSRGIEPAVPHLKAPASIHHSNSQDIGLKTVRGLKKISKSYKADIVTSGGHESHKGVSLVTLVINIVADLCPHGMLPLAYGLAQGGPTGLVPALTLVLLFGLASGYTMSLLAKLAVNTKSNSIGEVWGKLVGEKSQWVVDVSIFSLCFGCLIFYSAFIGDIFAALASTVFTDGLLSKRWFLLSALTGGILLPLCLLQDISALQFSSIIGVAGIVYTCLFHVYRFVKGTYSIGSPILEHLSPKQLPHWPTPKFVNWRVNSGSLVLMNMLCVAFLAHYNAISYNKELSNSTPQRYGLALTLGFGIAVSIFSIMMLVGYSIFGTAAQPLLLNNFARSKDVLASLARVAIGFAIVCAYPLMFAGAKTSMSNLFNLPLEKSSAKKNGFITAVVGLVLAIAIQCGEEDVSLVLGIVGSVLGCFVAYILPGFLDLAYMRKEKREGRVNSKWEVISSHGLVAVGTLLAVLGAWITVQTELHGSHEH